MTTEPQPQEPLNQIQLEAAVCDNDFARQALVYYHEAVSAYEEGRDLEIYLRSIETTYNRGFFGSHKGGLHDEVVQLVLDGCGQENPHYSWRLGYGEVNEYELSIFGKSLRNRAETKNTKQLPSFAERYAAEVEGAYDGSGHDTWKFMSTYEFDERSRRLTGINIDRAFDNQGRKRGQMDLINSAMARLGLVIDEPAVAEYFASLLPPEGKGDLYFDAVKSMNQAGDAVLLKLGNIKSELEARPEAYCKFLIREIGDLHYTGIIDVDKNVKDILTLFGDSSLFSRDVMQMIDDLLLDKTSDSHRKEDPKTLLNDALIAAGRTDLLVAESDQTVKDVQQTARHQSWLSKAEQGRLKRFDKWRLRKIARSMISMSPVWHVVGQENDPDEYKQDSVMLRINSQNKAALLALAIADDQKALPFYGYQAVRVTARKFVSERPHLFVGDANNTPAYVRNFPLEAIQAGVDPEAVLTFQATYQSQTRAEEIYKKITESEKKPPLVKMLAAITMAGAFAGESDSGLRIEAHFTTQLDMLALQTGYIHELHGLVAKSEQRQQLMHELQALQASIGLLPEAAQRQKLSAKAQEIQKVLDSLIPTPRLLEQESL